VQVQIKVVLLCDILAVEAPVKFHLHHVNAGMHACQTVIVYLDGSQEVRFICQL
jgi:hypothetical protein